MVGKRGGCVSDATQIRLLLAQFYEDNAPVVVASIDRTIWDHWDDDDELAWRAEAIRLFGADPSDYELREAWGTFVTEDLAAAFHVPAVVGRVDAA